MTISLTSLRTSTALWPPRVLIHAVAGAGKTPFAAGADAPVKLGGRLVYRLEDVEEYEREQLRASYADAPTKPAA